MLSSGCPFITHVHDVILLSFLFQARSEEQVAAARAWLDAERVWLVHRGGFCAARQLRETDSGEPLPEGRVRLKLEHNGDIIEVDEDDVEKVSFLLGAEGAGWGDAEARVPEAWVSWGLGHRDLRRAISLEDPFLELDLQICTCLIF